MWHTNNVSTICQRGIDWKQNMSNYPYLGVNGKYYEREFLEALWDELTHKAYFVAVRFDEFTKAEKFAYDVLRGIGFPGRMTNHED